MSTKNLARTVIEGGRRYSNRWFRRYSHKEERAAERQVSVRFARLETLDGVMYEPRRPLWREFNDKLAPAQRWRSLPIWFRERWDAFAAPPPERSI